MVPNPRGLYKETKHLYSSSNIGSIESIKEVIRMIKKWFTKEIQNKEFQCVGMSQGLEKEVNRMDQ